MERGNVAVARRMDPSSMVVPTIVDVGSTRKRLRQGQEASLLVLPTTTMTRSSKSIITQRLFASSTTPTKPPQRSSVVDTTTHRTNSTSSEARHHDCRQECSTPNVPRRTSLSPPSSPQHSREEASSTSSQSSCSSSVSSSPPLPELSFPSRVLLKMMHKRGCWQAREHSYATLPADFWQTPTIQGCNDAYSMELVTAVRQANLGHLQSCNMATLHARNAATGQTLLHLACRCQVVPVVHFLVHQAKVPVSVVDVYGRTPLHEALWTSRPPQLFDVANVILAVSPDLLLVQDVRGHTPLCYTRPEHWMAWLQHLGGRNIQRHLPRRLYSSSQMEKGDQTENDG